MSYRRKSGRYNRGYSANFTTARKLYYSKKNKNFNKISSSGYWKLRCKFAESLLVKIDSMLSEALQTNDLDYYKGVCDDILKEISRYFNTVKSKQTSSLTTKPSGGGNNEKERSNEAEES